MGLFLGAYIAHPIGGFLLGQYGDINGRRAVLSLSLLGLIIFTLIMAFLPTYDYFGVFAVILFTLTRFGQGLAYGSQIPSALVLMTEQLPIRYVGFGCGVILASILAGLILVKFLVAFLVDTLSHVDMVSYGWRIPFLVGTLLSIGALYALKSLDEVPMEAQIKNRQEQAGHTLSTMSFDGLTQKQIQEPAGENIFSHDKPVIHPHSFLNIITKNRLSSLIPAVLASWIVLSVFIVIAILMPNLLDMNFVIAEEELIFGSGISTLFMMIGCVFYGYLTDRMNVGKVMIAGGIFLIITTSLFFAQIRLGSSFLLIWSALLGFSGGMVATLPAVLARLFPSKIRLTSVALTYNATYVVVAGAMPTLLMIATFYLPLAPALYLLWVGLIAIFLSFYIYYLPRSERDIAR